MTNSEIPLAVGCQNAGMMIRKLSIWHLHAGISSFASMPLGLRTYIA